MSNIFVVYCRCTYAHLAVLEISSSIKASCMILARVAAVDDVMDGLCLLTEKKVDRRMNLSARFPANMWQQAQTYFSAADMPRTETVC